MWIGKNIQLGEHAEPSQVKEKSSIEFGDAESVFPLDSENNRLFRFYHSGHKGNILVTADFFTQ
jgi:hypothetical protein